MAAVAAVNPMALIASQQPAAAAPAVNVSALNAANGLPPVAAAAAAAAAAAVVDAAAPKAHLHAAALETAAELRKMEPDSPYVGVDDNKRLPRAPRNKGYDHTIDLAYAAAAVNEVARRLKRSKQPLPIASRRRAIRALVRLLHTANDAHSAAGGNVKAVPHTQNARKAQAVARQLRAEHAVKGDGQYLNAVRARWVQWRVALAKRVSAFIAARDDDFEQNAKWQDEVRRYVTLWRRVMDQLIGVPPEHANADAN